MKKHKQYKVWVAFSGRTQFDVIARTEVEAQDQALDLAEEKFALCDLTDLQTSGTEEVKDET